MVAFAEDENAESPDAGFGIAVAVEDAAPSARRPFSVSDVCSGEQGRATFTGYVADNESGLLHARARIYSPSLGRFISRDPMDYIDGWLVYAAYFAPNSVDPSGLGWWKKIKAILEMKDKAEKLKALEKLRGEIQRGIKSLEKNVEEHKKKLDDYISDPDGHDNKGLLKDAPNDEIKEKIKQGRIKELESQIEKNKREAEKAKEELDKLESSIGELGAGVAGAIGTIAAPYSSELAQLRKEGATVCPGDAVAGGILDLISIIDPGVLDAIDWAIGD